ncbi:glycosyltransferase family 25 protein [Kalamiella sp. sgz302252]|uniref:glycosyltransferase family 25 protein n=1 Tax=Pantoea sp. sgz302252 TaxID=3341827 RepID=UPI0036D42493
MLPIYIVSLKRDIQRRETLSAILDKYALNYEFVDAVYGKDLPAEEVAKFKVDGVTRRKGHKPTAGELGCTLSHLKIYQIMQERGQPWACILEDDAILDARFADFCRGFDNGDYSALHDDELYLLGGQNGLRCAPYVALSHWYKKRVGSERFRKSIKSENFLFRTCCYLIGAGSAAKLTALAREEFFVADEWNYFLRKGIFNNIFVANFVDHPLDLTTSLIEQERKEQQLKAFGQSAAVAAPSALSLSVVKPRVKRALLICRAQLRAFYI